MLVLLAPGQGSQTPGLLAPWLALPGAAAAVDRWSARTGLDLARLGTVADADEIRPTEVAQPLLVAVALLSGRAVLDGRTPDLVVGHSVGELAAVALAGVLDDDDAVALAAGRGAAMAAATTAATTAGASGRVPTGMAAVLGGDADAVRAAAEAAGLEVATVNAPGQLVLGGTVAELDAFTPPGRARLRRLDVAGAFHTRHMAPARDRFAALLAALAPRHARCPVVANADGALVSDGPALLERLGRQLTAPVRFDACLRTLDTARSAGGADTAVELAPGGTLAGLLRRALPDLPVVALRGPDDLAALADPRGADAVAEEAA